METVKRVLSNGEELILTHDGDFYKARVSSDVSNIGFEGDNGPIKEGETLENIADEIEMWLEDNINM